MELGRAFDPTPQARWRQADGGHAWGREWPDVRSLDRLSVARDPERLATEKLRGRFESGLSGWSRRDSRGLLTPTPELPCGRQPPASSIFVRRTDTKPT